jgi:hypothetical protein
MTDDPPSGDVVTGAAPARLAIWFVCVCCFAGLFVSLYGLFFYAIPEGNRDLVVLLVGSFVTNAGAIVAAIVRLRVGGKESP